MDTLLVKGSKIEYKNKIYEIGDMFSAELFEECNKIADNYDNGLCIVNEVFLSYVQPYKAIELFLSKFNIKLIKFQNADKKLIPLLSDYAKIHNIEIDGVPFLYKSTNKIYAYLNIKLTSLYLIWRMIVLPYKPELNFKKNKISLIRTPASKTKLSFLNDVDFRYEDYKDKNSIYSSFKRSERITWVFKSWALSYKEIDRYRKYVDNIIGTYSSYHVYKYYSKRIVHTLLYSNIIEEIFASNKRKIFYTGNNLDRFALIEEQTAKQNNVDIICIPHGIEYGFKLPHCFIGDKFFTTSLNASIHLNELYKTNKFIYDQDYAYKMFLVESKGINKDRNIVFFTEPREVEVNFQILDKLIPLLKSRDLQLFIKLHPKDIKSNYNKYLKKNVRIIEDFNESVTNNICISRKSTILLEAVYNDSDAAAILINSKDKIIFNNFPSLQDKKIKTFYKIDVLFDWIIQKSKKN